MTFKTELEKLNDSKEFKDWHKDNNKAYLSFGFTVLDLNGVTEWQIGFYNPDTDKVTSFTFDNGKPIIAPEEEVFKRPESKVLELKDETVKITLEKAIGISEDLQKDKYPAQDTIKSIVILQNLPGEGTVWNITNITKAFNTLNVKVAADSGEIKSHKLASLMDLKAKDEDVEKLG